MLFMTTYRTRPGESVEQANRLMEIFGKRGAEPGTIAHYVRVDGSGGVVIAETDDVMSMYEGTLAYTEFLDFDIVPIVSIDDAVGPLLSSLQDRAV